MSESNGLLAEGTSEAFDDGTDFYDKSAENAVGSSATVLDASYVSEFDALGGDNSADESEVCGFKLRPGWVLFTSLGLLIMGLVVGYKIGHSGDGVPGSFSSSSSAGAQNDAAQRKPSKDLGFAAAPLRSSLEKLRRDLENYYGTNGAKILVDANVNPPDSTSSVEYIAHKIARAFVHQSQFVIGVLGSSVAAGHDNCAYDNYEHQLERTLEPLWNLAGVAFSVRNAGETGGCGDDFTNQPFCVRHMVGDDIDALHYTWTYFGDKPPWHERILRWALLMDHSPPLTVFNVNEKSQYNGDQKLKDAYRKFGYTVWSPLGSLYKHTSWKGKKWGEIGDSLHNTTRYGELPNVSETRRKSLGVVFRNWHPGPLGFQMISDAFAYYYAGAMLKALDMIAKKQSEAKVRSLDEVWPAVPPLLTLSDLPRPVLCGKDPECLQPEPPSCVNFENPTHGRPQIIVLDHNDKMNPFAGKFEAKEGNPGWSFWTGSTTSLIPREERGLPQCKHSDGCAGWRSDSVDNGLITFRLPRMSLGLIVVCCGKGKNCAQTMFLNGTAEFRIENRVVNADELYQWPNGKCVRVQKQFRDSVDDAKGHIHLGVRNMAAQKNHEVVISHVIAY